MGNTALQVPAPTQRPTLSQCSPQRFHSSPDQLGLDAFEERFNGSIVITITFAAHGDFEVMLAEDLLVVMRTVLAAPIAVEDAAFGWHSEGDGHLQRTDRQVTLHAIADGPTDHAP